MPAFPPKFSSLEIQKKRAPLLGEHNEEVLRELLGCAASELEELRKRGVI